MFLSSRKFLLYILWLKESSLAFIVHLIGKDTIFSTISLGKCYSDCIVVSLKYIFLLGVKGFYLLMGLDNTSVETCVCFVEGSLCSCSWRYCIFIYSVRYKM